MAPLAETMSAVAIAVTASADLNCNFIEVSSFVDRLFAGSRLSVASREPIKVASLL
jgi:hypothetical protein